MLGTILFIDEGTGTAIVRADDGKRYRFPAVDWPADATPLSVGTRVDFDVDGDVAVGPLPVSEALATTLIAPPSAPPSPSSEPPAERSPETSPEPEAPQMVPPEPLAEPEPVAAPLTDKIPETATALESPIPGSETDPAPIPAVPVPPIDVQSADPMTEAAPVGRPISIDVDGDAPDYAGLSQPADGEGGGKSLLFVIGGVVLLLALAALAYMMWDNAAGSGETAELSEATVSLYAQEDVPVRNAASMTNSTVLGRIARGDRVTGREVPGSSDPTSRWLQLGDGNRFVPMTGLGPSAPPALPDPTPLPAPGFGPQAPADGNLDGIIEPQTGPGQSDDYSASGGPQLAPAPPAIRPTPRPQPAPPPRRPMPESTQPVQPSGPRPGPSGDPRDTQPVG